MDNNTFDSYQKNYSENNLWEKIKSGAQKFGGATVYAVLILYYTLESSSTPVWAKSIIIGALGYFILPVDAIPDYIPVVGYSDDLAALIWAIGAIALCINDEIKGKAKSKLKDWFPNYDISITKKVDNTIDKKKNENGQQE